MPESYSSTAAQALSAAAGNMRQAAEYSRVAGGEADAVASEVASIRDDLASLLGRVAALAARGACIGSPSESGRAEAREALNHLSMPVTGDGTNGVVARIGAWKLTAQEGHLAGVDSAFDTAARDGRHLDRTLEGILDTFDSEANRHTGRAETATEIGRELGTSAQIIAGLPMPTEQ